MPLCYESPDPPDIDISTLSNLLSSIPGASLIRTAGSRTCSEGRVFVLEVQAEVAGVPVTMTARITTTSPKKAKALVQMAKAFIPQIKQGAAQKAVGVPAVVRRTRKVRKTSKTTKA